MVVAAFEGDVLAHKLGDKLRLLIRFANRRCEKKSAVEVMDRADALLEASRYAVKSIWWSRFPARKFMVGIRMARKD